MPQLKGPVLAYGADTEDRSTIAKVPVGTRAHDGDGNEYLYIKAEGAIAVYAPVAITNGVGEAAQSADAKGFAGIASDAAFADEEYGYILSQGRGLALVPSGVSLGDTLTAGNGALSATLTSGTKFATVQEAPVLLSGTTQAKYVYLH
jgi:hypothetical protein